MAKSKGFTFYNQNRKLEFINSYATEKDDLGNPLVDNTGSYVYKTVLFRYARAAFNKLGKIESAYNKDLSDIQVKTDQEMIKDIYLICFSNVIACTGRITMAIYRAYLSWCLDNNYITTKQYGKNPFSQIASDEFDKITMSKSRSERVRGTLRAINDVDEIDSDHVFKTEEEFFSYVAELFEPDTFTMQAAAYCLLYYGFSYYEIVDIKREEIDDAAHTVRNILIDNDTAFDLILRAKYATVFHTFSERRTSQTCYYCDGRYLIRSSKKKTADTPLAISTITTIPQYLEKAANELPIGHKYKKIRVQLSTVRKLKMFYAALNDREQYGEDRILEKLKNKEYGTLNLEMYHVMLAKLAKQ